MVTILEAAYYSLLSGSLMIHIPPTCRIYFPPNRFVKHIFNLIEDPFVLHGRCGSMVEHSARNQEVRVPFWSWAHARADG